MLSRQKQKQSINFVYLTLVSCFALTSCATPGNDPSLSPAENQLRQSHARFSNTVGEGAAFGAVAGGLAGALLGGRNRVAAAAVGAAAGGALGGGAGYVVARNNAMQSHSEADLNGAISQAQQQATDLHLDADASRTIADDAVRQIAALDAQYQSQQITAAQFRSQVGKYQANNKLIGEEAQDAEADASSLRTFADSAGQQRSSVLQTAASMEQSRNTIQESAAAMTQALNQVPQGA